MLTSDFFNKPTTEEKTRLDPKCWTGKKIGNPKTKMKGGVRVNNCVPVEEETENNPVDTVEMDVPLLIRALEYAREDAKDDMDLHKVVERMITAAQAGEPLNMDDYNMIFGDSEEEPVAEGKFDPINDDDFYEYNVDTNEIVSRISGKHPEARRFTSGMGQREWPGRDDKHKFIRGINAKYLKSKGQDVVDEAKKKKKKKSKPSLMSKPTKRRYGGYFYPGYGYGDSGDSGSSDGGGGGESRMNESRLYYTVAGTLTESLRKDFKMRKDRKGWFLPESATSRQKLDAERAFGEPINEADLLRPIRMKATKDPVARSKNASKFKNAAKSIQFKK